MQDTGALHRKVQEMADCYKGTDYLKEMSLVPSDSDASEAALKWVALAVLHGINANAEKVSLRRHPDGEVTVLAEYRASRLPSPGGEVGEKVLQALRDLLHFEDAPEKQKGLLAFGWGNESLELRVKIKRKDGRETVTLKFPE